MNDAISIRNATPDDADAIAPLLGQLGYPTSTEQARQRLLAMQHGANGAVLVAIDGAGRVRGCIGLEQRTTIDSGAQAEVMTLVVDAGVRRGGVGLALLQAGEAWARERGFGELLVHSNITRAESHPFYAKHGFARKKTQHFYAKALQGRPLQSRE